MIVLTSNRLGGFLACAHLLPPCRECVGERSSLVHLFVFAHLSCLSSVMGPKCPLIPARHCPDPELLSVSKVAAVRTTGSSIWAA